MGQGNGRDSGNGRDVDPNDLWLRRGQDPIRVSLPGAPMKCVAVAARGTRECRNWAVSGANVCRNHGGAAPQTKAAAQRRLAEVATFRDLFARVAHAAETDPLDALLTELARSSVIVEGLSQLVGDLGIVDDQGDGTSIVAPDMNLNPLVKWMNEERDRKARYAQMAIQAGVEERVVRVQERQAVMFAAVIGSALADPDLGLEPARVAIAREVFGKHLRALPSAS